MRGIFFLILLVYLSSINRVKSSGTGLFNWQAYTLYKRNSVMCDCQRVSSSAPVLSQTKTNYGQVCFSKIHNVYRRQRSHGMRDNKQKKCAMVLSHMHFLLAQARKGVIQLISIYILSLWAGQFNDTRRHKLDRRATKMWIFSNRGNEYQGAGEPRSCKRSKGVQRVLGTWFTAQ